ncbi:molybdopterin-dependent oxidoreductase [candidate division CSSED10-310 bacterium]|uniref:Molybdopterin-dependent oxidoreductase n=1 Tax=candidate division CSSED10-310 bacterium TaxID=2855610 RepID=A0ABV6Z5W8_UNCC1
MQQNVKKTYCGRMDHGGCGLIVTAQNNQIVSIKGDPESPRSRGYICFKGLHSAEKLNHPQRLRYPLKRKGPRGSGQWERISWEEALQYIAERFNTLKKTYGPSSVAFCQGAPKGLEHFLLIRLANIFGSPNVVGPQNVCHMPREISAKHTLGFFPVVDYEGGPNCMLLWGSNLTATNEEGVICSTLLRVLKSGTPLIVVDPRKTDLARKAALWLQLTPGSDTYLALSLLYVIVQEHLYDEIFVQEWTSGFDDLRAHIEKFSPEVTQPFTNLEPELVYVAARMYAQSRPAAIQWGNGIEQTTNNFDVCRAILCLMALTNNIDCRGGNIQATPPPVIPLGKFVRSDVIPDKARTMVSAYEGIIPGLMIVPPTLIKKAMITGKPYPIKGAYIQVTNPVIAWADSKNTLKAFHSLDFVVVSEIFMTPSAALADVVLPAATQYEFNDIGHFGLAHGYILARPKIVEPLAECKSDIEIINELGKVLTSPKLWWSDLSDMLNLILKPAGLSYEEFVERGLLCGKKEYQKYLKKGFKTATKKIELKLSTAETMKLPSLPQVQPELLRTSAQYPFLLIGHKSRYFFCSGNREAGPARNKRPVPLAFIHPDTALKVGIKNNEKIVLETPSGSFFHYASITAKINPGIISATHGWWFPEKNQQLSEGLFGSFDANINAATSSDTINTSFGTPNLRNIPCLIKGTGELFMPQK